MKDKLIEVFESYQDAIEDNGSAFWESIREEHVDRILAIQEEEAKERYEEAIGLLDRLPLNRMDRLISNEAIRIASGHEPTK